MPRITNLIHPSTKTILPLALLGTLIMASPLVAQNSAQAAPAVPAKLVQDVRQATQQFIDVRNARQAGYAPAFGCVSGPDHGAMGIHYVNGTLVGDGKIEVEHPEALIYEPDGNRRRLVGVEYIVDAATWLKNHNNTPPSLDGQDFQFVAAPKPFSPGRFLRATRLGMAQQPPGCLRRLEQSGNLRRRISSSNEAACPRSRAFARPGRITIHDAGEWGAGAHQCRLDFSCAWLRFDALASPTQEGPFRSTPSKRIGQHHQLLRCCSNGLFTSWQQRVESSQLAHLCATTTEVAPSVALLRPAGTTGTTPSTAPIPLLNSS
jgi:hypothetical protein